MKSKNVLMLLILIIFAFFCFFFLNNLVSKFNSEIKKVEIGGKIIKVSVVSTVESREKGLSGRESIAEDEGMLFVFENLGRHGFWMKDMNFPIDIIWLDQSKKIIFIKKNVLPSTYPEIFYPDSDANYVLEVISGFSEKNNLQIGNYAKF